MPFAFEKLRVYQRAVDFADRIATLTSGFPRGYYYLADQFNRASLSISLNIAEGNDRFTKLENSKQNTKKDDHDKSNSTYLYFYKQPG